MMRVPRLIECVLLIQLTSRFRRRLKNHNHQEWLSHEKALKLNCNDVPKRRLKAPLPSSKRGGRELLL